jgi:hypothetical protein
MSRDAVPGSGRMPAIRSGGCQSQHRHLHVPAIRSGGCQPQLSVDIHVPLAVVWHVLSQALALNPVITGHYAKPGHPNHAFRHHHAPPHHHPPTHHSPTHMNNRPSRDMLFRNNVFATRHVAIGSEESGGVANITITNCTLV